MGGGIRSDPKYNLLSYAGRRLDLKYVLLPSLQCAKLCACVDGFEADLR